jgi:5'-phosphate synthase pdxT subunit
LKRKISFRREVGSVHFKAPVRKDGRYWYGSVKIGILAVQGDFAAHAAMLRDLGVESVEVRTPAGLLNCDGLILPGGESTTQLQFLQEEGLDEAIRKFVAHNKPIFGTCAGAILLANEVKNPKQESLKLLDITVLRNGYGRQVHSDVVAGPTTLKDEPLEMVFIRAPIIERVGANVKILAEYAGKPALVQKGNVLAAAFHPELTGDITVHSLFLKLASERGHLATERNGTRPHAVKRNGAKHSRSKAQAR